MLAFLLHPMVPFAADVVFLWWLFNQRGARPVAPKMDRSTARLGDLAADGSAKTSKPEKSVREVIERAGYRTYPQGTMMCMGYDSAGKKRFFTPDILLQRPFAVVEYDPAHWHGAPEKVAEDVMRNRFYARAGLKIIRVRIDGTQALGPNDVVIAESEFDAARDGAAVLRAIGRAREVPSNYWDNMAV
ncbi:Uncharacterised protein (plasmid) [Tsukamurella tyrosinosolvens]|uniref:Uncharacterized protein n=1 Tax=Tsukamurella tyrosinosolvens TaxID=57704 RepID=A0A1H4U188_TSUTY|nr:hypothetical protein [Tsukamurella tyrosinosolvens]KXO93043.1 hypothetical protein AXK58_14325 [Tsukamurella tyrosinosolvens]SEC62447.1 hypothetical protein SAMN04489793_2764 [Tsukamurella tyrosinosolvens]VEH93953.1 Uncharacterised protein [Tsukamurella tyrosinosolvens]